MDASSPTVTLAPLHRHLRLAWGGLLALSLAAFGCAPGDEAWSASPVRVAVDTSLTPVAVARHETTVTDVARTRRETEDEGVTRVSRSRESEDRAARDPVGTWYLNVGGDVTGARMTLTVGWSETLGQYVGTIAEEVGATTGQTTVVPVLEWTPSTGRLLFARDSSDGARAWFDGTVVQGVIRGRMGRAAAGQPEPAAAMRTTHFTGWNSAQVDTDVVPRVWDVTLDNAVRATLRIDRAGPNDARRVGTLKVYASLARGVVDEERQYDLDVQAWDGRSLTFVAWHDGQPWTYVATAEGRHLTGAFTTPDSSLPHALGGVRSEVFSYGLSVRDANVRAVWQTRTAARLRHLMMADAPTPTETRVRWISRDQSPIPALPTAGANRDDAMRDHPAAYTLSEAYLDETLPNPYGEGTLSRTLHVFLARPTTAPPPGGYPVAIALNGHYGGAWSVMDPNGWYWYGDAFARRGYVVASVDMSHRPVVDRRGMYQADAGEDEAHGNGLHPAIKAPGMDSDWEEDGERAWDAMRTLDWALAQPNVNPARVVATGHSMGGSVTTVFSALDPRVSVAVPSGFTPDLGDLHYGAGHACWRWLNGDAREYVSVSDYHSLIAPRGLIVETGARDQSYSIGAPPFAGAKQVMRTSLTAFDGTSRCVHFLHADGHVYHAADPADSIGAGVTVPTLDRPSNARDLSWQTDPGLTPLRRSIFEVIQTVEP